MTRNRNRRAALIYVRKMSWFVFPIDPQTRNPLVHWKTESSNDPNQIEEWWKRWPAASIALDCGRSGVTVVDIDTDGVFVCARFRYATLTARTGREGGGRHLFFRGTVVTKHGERGLGEHIDLQSVGGFVILPPSRHWKTDRPYTWLNNLPLMEFPPELKQRLDHRTLCAAHANPEPSTKKKEKGRERPAHGRFYYHGEREHQLLRIACAMAHRGEGYDAIRAELERVFDRFCQKVPEDPVDLDKLTRQALKYAGR